MISARAQRQWKTDGSGKWFGGSVIFRLPMPLWSLTYGTLLWQLARLIPQDIPGKPLWPPVYEQHLVELGSVVGSAADGA